MDARPVLTKVTPSPARTTVSALPAGEGRSSQRQRSAASGALPGVKPWQLQPAELFARGDLLLLAVTVVAGRATDGPGQVTERRSARAAQRSGGEVPS